MSCPHCPHCRREIVARLAAYGRSDPQIAEELGCAVSTVQRFRARHSIPAALPQGGPRKAVAP